MSTNSKIFKNTIFVTLAGGLAQVVGFVIPVLIANFFGVNSQVDSYYFSIGIPTTIVTMIIGGAIKIVFIPLYLKQKKENQKLLPDFLGQFFILLMILSVSITVLLVLYVRFVGLGFLSVDSTQIYSEQFLILSSPIIILSVLFQFVNAIYNANQKFLIIELTSVLKFGVVILMIYFFHQSLGIIAAIYGHIIGQTLSLIIGIIALKYSRMSLKMNFSFSKAAFSHLIGSSALAFGAFVFAQSTPIFQKVIAGIMEEGNISILGYAERLSIIPSFLIGSSFGVILTTFWSDLQLSKKSKELENSFNMSLEAMVMVILPLAAGGIFLSEQIVSVVFKRGSFDQSVSISTALVFSFFLLQIIPAQLQLILSRVLHVFQDMRYLFVFSLIAFVVNTVLMFSFSIYLGFGLIGIPLGLFVGRVVFTVVNIFYINKKYVTVDLKGQALNLSKVVLSTLVMLWSLFLTKRLLNFDQKLLLLLFNILLGFLFYSLVLKLLRNKIFMLIIDKVLRVFLKN